MIEWLAQLDEKEKTKAIHRAFAQVASTQDGAIVFATIFEHLYLFRPCPTPEAKALNEYGKFLLHFFGPEVQYDIFSSIMMSARQPVQEMEDEKNGD